MDADVATYMFSTLDACCEYTFGIHCLFSDRCHLITF